MKILIITHTFPKNNSDVSAAFMKPFADAIVSAGHEVIVLTPYTPGFKRKGDKFKVITYKYIYPDFLHKMGYSNTMNSDLKMRKDSYLLAPFMIFFGIVKTVSIIRKGNIDVINAHWVLPNGFIAYMASIITGTKYVVTIPGTDMLLAKKNFVFSRLSKVIANNASYITSNSAYLLKEFKNATNFKNKNTKVISYPVDTSHLKPSKNGVKSLRDKHNINHKDFVILAVGRLVYKKGFEYLIRAVPNILKKAKNTKLIIIGDGDITYELVSLADKLKIKDNVIFAGKINRNDIGKYYNLSDVLCAPSIVDKNGNADGGPVVVAESMACAKPQVLTNILGMAKVVKDVGGGIVVSQKNSSELAKAIIRIQRSKNLKREMGLRNRTAAMDKLSINGAGKEYDKIFKYVVKG